MSQIYSPGYYHTVPGIPVATGNTATTSGAITTTGQSCHYVGTIILENPNSGPKTISAAGGGSITWSTGTVTNADAATVFDVGIQDVSTTTSPAQGDGVFDVNKTYSGAGALASNTSYTSVMTSGSKTISNGQLIAVAFTMTTRGGADSIVVTNCYTDMFTTAQVLPVVTKSTGGTFSRVGTSYPNCYITFDDGTIGWFYGGYYSTTTVGSVSIASNTAVADEYANLINVPYTFVASGVSVTVSANLAASDYEIILYTDPLTNPTAVRTITMDSTQAGVLATPNAITMSFSTPYTLKANTPYAISVRPTTTNALSVYYLDPASVNGAKTLGVGSNFYSVRRLDNAGAFSDYNGGTAKTRIMLMKLVGGSMEQGVNNASWHLGTI